MHLLDIIAPAKLSRNLHQVSLYLTAWETLKSSILDRVHDFYTHEWRRDSNGNLRGKRDAAYKEKVTSLYPKDDLHACVLWLQQSGAFDDSHITIIKAARSHRNAIAHEIRDFIATDTREVSRDSIASIREVVKHLDSWWLAEIELAIRTDTTPEMIDAARRGEAIGGYSFLLDLILPIFDGDFSQLERLEAELRNRAEQACDGKPDTAVS